jgi:effector-binding domain-containing protein
MKYAVVVETVRPRHIAAVRAKVNVGGVAAAWKPALDEVWEFLRSHKKIRTGHNLFLYHHPNHRGDPMDVDFGVQVKDRFEQSGDISCVETPAGRVAFTVHTGPYSQLKDAHDAIHAWCADHNQRIGNTSWELYGDWNEDESKLQTTIYYLLRE